MPKKRDQKEIIQLSKRGVRPPVVRRHCGEGRSHRIGDASIGDKDEETEAGGSDGGAGCGGEVGDGEEGVWGGGGNEAAKVLLRGG